MQIVYYVASSLDGYIADENGGVNWLAEFQIANEDYGYAKYFSSVDSMVMGRATYEQVLGFGDWPYGDKPCWVMSSKPFESKLKQIRFSNQSPRELIDEISSQNLSKLWLVGGAKLANSLRDEGLITEYQISIMPTLLGGGISLFESAQEATALELIEHQSHLNGVVQLKYAVNRTSGPNRRKSH